jgi:hypothetical protein
VLAARRSAEVAHKSHYKRAFLPPIPQLDRPFERLNNDIGESIINRQLAHAAIVPGLFN